MLKEKLMKKMEKNKKLSPMEKDAKMSVIKSLGDQAMEAMRGKMGDMKKVTVASDSKEGLKEGLNKAEEIVEGAEEELHADLDKDNESGESSEHKAKVLGNEIIDKDMSAVDEACAEMSPEELDEQIKKLLELKRSKEQE